MTLSGNGKKPGESVVRPQDLYDCFAGIEGKNVLIMDCCYSGTMGSQTRSIGLQSLLKNTVSRDEAAETFVDQFTEGFAQAEKEISGSYSPFWYRYFCTRPISVSAVPLSSSCTTSPAGLSAIRIFSSS